VSFSYFFVKVKSDKTCFLSLFVLFFLIISHLLICSELKKKLCISVLYICIVVGDQLLRGEDWISLTDLVSARFCAYPKTEFGFPSMFSLVLFVCIDFRREAVVRFVAFGGMVVNHCFHRNLDRNVHQF